MIRLAGTNETKGGRHHPVLQALIVLAVAGLVAALAIPAFAAQAKSSVLRQNQAELAQQLRSDLVLGADTGVSPSNDGASSAAIDSALSASLRSEQDGRFVNPFSGSSAITAGSAPPAVRPAIWITDDAAYAYVAFSPSKAMGSRLAGSLIVALTDSDAVVVIDVYSVDAQGRRSPTLETIAAPAGVWQE